jgi:serine/threonine protein phosphatase PrpC
MDSPVLNPNSQSALPASPIVSERFRVGFATDIGRRRSQNQDNLAVAADLGLFMVADGMGGHQGGETASSIATQVVPHLVRDGQQRNPNWDARTLISQAVRGANEAIFKRALETPSLHGMGTTATALLFKKDHLYIGHVGDSRCYLFRRGSAQDLACWQVTRDHSLVQEKLRAGLITREEIKTDKMKNVITRSVGFERDVNVETYHVQTRPGDVYLICSDGLSGLINEAKILEIVRKQLQQAQSAQPNLGAQIQQTVRQLIDAANENGGDDNITSIVIEVL